MTQKLADFIAIFLGLRKTLVMGILIAIGIIFRVKGLIDGNQLVALLQGTSIAFFAANSIEHVGETIKHYVNSKGQQVTEEEAVVGDSGSNNG
jgi:hypothetical protein